MLKIDDKVKIKGTDMKGIITRKFDDNYKVKTYQVKINSNINLPISENYLQKKNDDKKYVFPDNFEHISSLHYLDIEKCDWILNEINQEIKTIKDNYYKTVITENFFITKLENGKIIFANNYYIEE
jgi:hypothetical protein